MKVSGKDSTIVSGEQGVTSEFGYVCFGRDGLPRIVLVDDVWFHDYFRRHHAFASDLFEGRSELDFDALEEALTRARGQPDQSRKFSFDVDLLLRLIPRCRSRYQLCLSSFAAFRSRFSGELDQADTAILISLGHDASGKLTFDGPSLLHSALKGCRPRAELVFITGYPRELEAHFEAEWKRVGEVASDPRQRLVEQARWWVLRSLPVVEKYSETLDAHLNGFFDFFAQRFHADGLAGLARGLFLAQSFNAEGGPDGDPAHLRSLEVLEAWEARHGDFPLSGLFHEHGGDPAGAVESFKALFSINQKAHYRMSFRCLRDFLKRGGIDLDCPASGTLLLPSRPGAMFVFGLLRFLVELRELPLRLALLPAGDGHALVLPLQRPEVFGDALLTRNSGGAVGAFRDWLSGTTGPLVAVEPRLGPLLRPWQEAQTNLIDGHHPVWRPIFNYRVENEALCVSWPMRCDAPE